MALRAEIDLGIVLCASSPRETQVGSHSAVGMAEVAKLMKCSYRLIAPKRLAAAVRES